MLIFGENLFCGTLLGGIFAKKRFFNIGNCLETLLRAYVLAVIFFVYTCDIWTGSINRSDGG